MQGNIPAAYVLDWTSTRLYIICPFASCDQKVHGHGYTAPSERHLNTRVAHCYPAQSLEYRLLFPYEEDVLVKNFGFILDRKNLRWASVAEELNDPRIDKEELLSTSLARSQISEASHPTVLDNEIWEEFLSNCVTHKHSVCSRELEESEHLETLVKGKLPENGQTALSLACREGRLEIAISLLEHGAELNSVDDRGRTPLMLAADSGHGQTASYLAGQGASLFINDNDGMTTLQAAKTAFRKLSELESRTFKIPIYASGIGSSNSFEEMKRKNYTVQLIKERKEGLNQVIDLYEALELERNIKKKSASTERTMDHTFHIIKENKSYMPRVGLSKGVFETKMKSNTKAFAYLDRGRAFEHIHAAAISGYKAEQNGDSDGCLSRNVWTSRVIKYCKVLQHELSRVNGRGIAVSEEVYACHVEKQLMAYFLWKHTTIDRKFDDCNNDDDEETWGNCEKIHDLQNCKPDVESIKRDIYVSREPCSDCNRFQKRLHEREGILFNFIFIQPINT